MSSIRYLTNRLTLYTIVDSHYFRALVKFHWPTHMRRPLRDPNSSPSLLGFWRRRLGLEMDVGQAVDAPYALMFAGQWHSAVQAWAQLGCPYELALALLDGGETGARDALSVFESLGAAAAARRSRRNPRPTGDIQCESGGPCRA